MLPAQEGWAKDYASRDINGFKSWLGQPHSKVVALSQTQMRSYRKRRRLPRRRLKPAMTSMLISPFVHVMGVDPEDVARYAGDE
ncbi:hypothetical protein ACLBOM_00615 [Escherichia coli]